MEINNLTEAAQDIEEFDFTKALEDQGLIDRYLDTKKLLAQFVGYQGIVTSNNDIIQPVVDSEESLVIEDKKLKKMFYCNTFSYTRNKLELVIGNSREIAIELDRHFLLIDDADTIEDDVNQIKYSLGYASEEYSFFILCMISDLLGEQKRNMPAQFVIRKSNRIQRMGKTILDHQARGTLLSALIGVQTLRVEFEDTDFKREYTLQDAACAYEFSRMYRSGIVICESVELTELFPWLERSSRNIVRYEKMESAPNRIYNQEVLGYYTMAMESRDPFTKYISFYHVIEHYFDAVYRKNLIKNMRDKITHPDFSYKNDDKLYEFAKYIKKQMNADTASGKGNERESLEYVLMEYIPLDSLEDLKNRISILNGGSAAYYQETKVSFVHSKDTKISWSDLQGVYNRMAVRIYETRNALVHSKSEQSRNQYRPYEHRKDLTKEIPLIRAIAEQVLINSSEPM